MSRPVRERLRELASRAGGEALAHHRLLLLLALPSLGMALTATIVTTFVPVLIAEFTGPALTGLLIGTEGLLALFLPLVIGRWSDRLESRFGGRFPFLLAAAPVVVVAVALMPVAKSLPVIALLVVGFFAAYLTYGTPYRAVYPDLVPDGLRGRSQGVQTTLRETGTGLALVSGGLLLALWQPLPFVIAAAVFAAITTAFVVAMLRRGYHRRAGGGGDPPPSALETYSSIARDRPIRRIVLANGLWELALGAIKTFVVLFIVVGLDRSTSFASLVLGGTVAAVVVAAVVGGALADRIGHLRLLRGCTAIYGLGLLVPAFTQSAVLVAVVPVAAFAAGVTMTLSFSVLMGLLPERGHGAGSAVFELSRGLGSLMGPLLAGVAIELADPLFPGTDGYAAMWLVAAAAVLASLLLLRRLEE
jgi:Na+/melibiose symporter-like transporter